MSMACNPNDREFFTCTGTGDWIGLPRMSIYLGRKQFPLVFLKHVYIYSTYTVCIYSNTNTNITQMTLFLLEKGIVFGKVEVELGLQVKGHTRWFNPWPFHPRSLEVTYPLHKKGHPFTILKRSPAELPGTFFLVNHSMNFKFWGYSITTFQTSMNMFHLNTLQQKLNTCTTETLVVHDRCWVDVSDFHPSLAPVDIERIPVLN